MEETHDDTKPAVSFFAVFVIVLYIIQTMSCKQLYAANFVEIADDLNVNRKSYLEFLGGYVESAAAACSMLGALCLGVVGDKVDASKALSLNANLASLCTLSVGLLHGQGGLPGYVIPRLAASFFVGGCLPLAFKTIDAISTASLRPSCVVLVLTASAVGMAVGQFAALKFGGSIGWHNVCIVVGETGFVANLLIFISTRNQAFARNSPPAWCMPLPHEMSLLINRRNLLIWTQGFFACQMWGILTVFFYAIVLETMHIENRDNQLWTFILWGSGSLVGKICALSLSSLLEKWPRGKAYTGAWLAASTTLGVAAQVAFLLLYLSTPWQLALLFVSSLFASVQGPLVHARLLEINCTEVKATACGVLEVCDNLGFAAGPLALAFLMQHLSLRHAVAAMSGSWFLAGLLACGL